ncbi:MAG: hypothetical protein U5L45_06140 [Saprospiraceae bacterium]|nr:hypothetical protein [Saprospiraceae bacterium]
MERAVFLLKIWALPKFSTKKRLAPKKLPAPPMAARFEALPQNLDLICNKYLATRSLCPHGRRRMWFIFRALPKK